ncbi:MAG TPA: ATP-dependent helicase [Pyrinomonadaceae bacterium]
MGLILVFGPPGTGKTEYDLRQMEAWRNEGISLDEIAYVSFMKTAVKDGAKRFGLTEQDNRWFRTLHSLCFRVLELTRDSVVDPKWMKEWAKKVGFQVADEEEGGDLEDFSEAVTHIMATLEKPDAQTEGSRIKSLYDLSRLLSRSVEELDYVKKQPHPGTTDYQWPGFSAGVYAHFVALYEKGKAEDQKFDFTDMLAEVLRRRFIVLPKWKRAVIDEIQDMSPLQFAVIEKLWFGRCETILFSGDDDQAIFSFQGANAHEFLKYRNYPDTQVKILEQTHRFGPNGVRYAGLITDRIKERQPKNVIGLAGRENPIRNKLSFDPAEVMDGDLLLHRHVAGCSEIADRLVDEGVPFYNERRGSNPFKNASELNAYLAFRDLSEGKSITATGLQYLLKKVPSLTVDKRRLVFHGVKKKAEALKGNETVSFGDLSSFFTEGFMKAIREKNRRDVDLNFGDYYDKLNQARYDFEKLPKTRIGTIHASKGRQAKRVWLWAETFPKALAKAGDDEHRVAFVGATRMQHELMIVRERLIGDWTREYRYPETDNTVLVRTNE